MSEKYRTVTTTVKSIREKSIVIQVKNRQGTNIIARSLIHMSDDLTLEKFKKLEPREHTFRVFAWKADDLGLS
jgi:hypothetical protein